MQSYLGKILGVALIGSALTLAACGKKATEDNTNVVEMNASDGTMNDMSVIESSTLDQAGGNASDAGSNAAGDVSNGG